MTRPLPGPPADAGQGPILLGGRYELLELLGRGGMAAVYRARDPDLSRFVAVKLLPTGSRADGVETRRLEAEARATAGLNHPHIVAVHDVGVSTHGVYVVMELLAGRTWRDELGGDAAQAEPEVMRIGAAVASALAAAHARGIVHRDVNPSNVMLLEDGSPKLMDFGIARTDTDGGLTETGQVVGTAAYMSPEQVRGELLDGRSDVYSLGCSLYEAATGRPPFVGRGSADVAAVRLREDPVPPRQVAPGLSVGVEDVIQRTLARDPTSRPDAAALASALRELARPRRDPLRIPEPRSEDMAVDGAEPGSPTSVTASVDAWADTVDQAPQPHAPVPGAGLRRVGLALVTLGLLALAVLLVLAWM